MHNRGLHTCSWGLLSSNVGSRLDTGYFKCVLPPDKLAPYADHSFIEMSDFVPNSGFLNAHIMTASLAFDTSAYPAPNAPSRGPNHQDHNARFIQNAFSGLNLPEGDLNRRRFCLSSILNSPSWLLQISPVTATQAQDFVIRAGRRRAICCFCRRRGFRMFIIRCARRHLA